jgi:hypothetical protein
MSKHKSNVNPDYYKTAGREPMGRDVVQEVHRQEYAQAKALEKRNEAHAGARDPNPPAAKAKEDDAATPAPAAPRVRPRDRGTRRPKVKAA